MPNDTLAANAAPMPTWLELTNVVDALSQVKQLLSAVADLVEHIPLEEREPIATVLFVAEEKLVLATEHLDTCRLQIREAA
jgi:Flp pilus assembly protein TadB